MNKSEPVRVTKPTLKVAAYLSDLKGASTWGLQICAETGLGSGSVYSVLDRFEGYGWVESYWEEDNSRRGARRRLYKVTTLGKGSLKELVTDHAAVKSPIRNLKKAQA